MYYDVLYTSDPDDQYLESKVPVTFKGVTFWHCLVSEKNLGLLPAGWVKWNTAPLWMKKADGSPLHEYMGRSSVLTDRDGGFKTDEF